VGIVIFHLSQIGSKKSKIKEYLFAVAKVFTKGALKKRQ
jgi:hypothetical protein